MRVDALLAAARTGLVDELMAAGRYTLIDQEAAAELLPLCAEQGVAGRRRRGLQRRTARRRARSRLDLRLRRRVPRDPRPGPAGSTVCQDAGVPLRAAALQFPLRHPAVRSVVVGARDAARDPRELPAREPQDARRTLGTPRADVGSDVVTVVDAHLHVWDLEVGDYSWLGPQHGPCTAATSRPRPSASSPPPASPTPCWCRPRTPRPTPPGCSRWPNDVRGCSGSWAGCSSTTPRSRPPSWTTWPAASSCGIRHLVHDDPQARLPRAAGGAPEPGPGRRARAALRRARRLAATPRGRGPAGRRPPRAHHRPRPSRASRRGGRDDYGAWETALRRAAARPNVVAKLSGLHRPGQPFTVEALRPVARRRSRALRQRSADVRQRLADDDRSAGATPTCTP